MVVTIKMLKNIVTISVILNVIFLGTTVGMAYKHWNSIPPHHKEIRKALTPEVQHLMARHFREGKSEISKNFKKARKTRKELVSLMKAEQFDAEAWKEKAEEMMVLQQKMMQSKINVTLDLASELSPQDRAQLAYHLSRMGPPPGAGKRGKHHTQSAISEPPHKKPDYNN